MSIAKATELEKQAKQLSTKSLIALRFSVDHDQAGITYDKAAHLYKSNKDLKGALRCYELAAKEHRKAGNLFHAGKALDNLATVNRDQGLYNKAIESYKMSAEILLEDGKLDRAAETLIKGAKMIEKHMLKETKKLSNENKKLISDMYVDALAMYANGDKYYMGTNAFRTYNAFLLKNGMYQECLDNMENQIKGYVALKQPHNVAKNVLSMVLVQLKMSGDSIAAEEIQEDAMSKHSEYAETHECQLAAQLIQAFERKDAELLESTKEDRDFRYLEAQVSKIARKITLDNVKKVKPKRVRVKKENAVSDKKKELLGDEGNEDLSNSDEEDSDDDMYEDEPDALDEDNLC